MWSPGVFASTGLAIVPNIDVNVQAGQTYFERANESIAGDFGIRPMPQIASGRELSSVAYVLCHDFSKETTGDGNFDVFIVRLQRLTNGTWLIGTPHPINAPDTDVRSDQFMPAICYGSGPGKFIHVTWYDTRHDLKGLNEDVKIALYYARLRDTEDDPNGEPGFVVEELMLDQEAIDTAYLRNKKFLGDRIDITASPGTHDAIVVYMGTEHPRTSGHTAPQTDEAIFSYLVHQNVGGGD